MKGRRIRPMEEGDLPQVLPIERSSFPTPWTAKAFLQEMTPPSFSFVSVQEGERVLGYVVFRLILEEVHILNLAVAPPWRRQGVGRELLRFCVDFCWRRGGILFSLEVREGNLPAIGLYRKMGFALRGRRPGYYRDTGEDALLMELYLGGQIRASHGPGRS